MNTRCIVAKFLWLLTLMLPMAVVHAAAAHAVGHRVTINGHILYYEVRGTGRPLLLLHGGGDSGQHSFAQQLRSFVQHHRLILPDQVGQGRTPDVPGALSYTSMMHDTATLLQRLHLHNVDVVGFSDGGILALMLAVRYPQLIRRVIVSGVNVAPNGLTTDTLEQLRAMSVDDTEPTIDAKLRQLWLNSPTEQELNLQLLSTVRNRVLVMAGDRDAITLEHTLQIYRAIPHAELCILPGTDHGTFAARPQWVNSIALGFLQRN